MYVCILLRHYVRTGLFFLSYNALEVVPPVAGGIKLCKSVFGIAVAVVVVV
jgi:hypothetical protein